MSWQIGAVSLAPFNQLGTDIVGIVRDLTAMLQPYAIAMTPGEDEVYVAANGHERVVSIDVTNKSNPAILHSRSGSYGLDSSQPSQLVKRGNRLWVGGQLRLSRLDVSVPAAMTLSANTGDIIPPPAFNGSFGLSDGDAPSNAYGFIGVTGGTRIDGASGVMLFGDNLTGNPAPIGRIWSEDSHMFIGSLTQTLAIRAADASATAVASLSNAAFAAPRDVFKAGDVCFVVGFTNKALTSVDVSTYASPSVIQSLSLPNSPAFGAWQDDMVYVTSSADDCIWVIDASDPSDMEIVATKGLGANHWQIVVDGDYAYTTSPSDHALYITDIS